jgi:hypothetical protein
MYFRVKPAPSTVGAPPGSAEDNSQDKAGQDTKETLCGMTSSADDASFRPSRTIERSDSQTTVLATQTNALSVTDSKSTIAVEESISIETKQASSSSIPLSISLTEAGLPTLSSLDTIPNSESEFSKRFVSAFRGRQIHGLDASLPKGYTGVVLRSTSKTSANATSELDSQRRDQTKGKGKARSGNPNAGSRRSTRTTAADDDDMVIDVHSDAEEQDTVETNVKDLRIASTFSSIRLWQADIPVMEKEDLYARSMKEWTSLAALIHDCD